MATLTVTTFSTLDGVVQAPGGRDEDRSGGFDCGGWVMPYFEETLGAFMAGVFARAGAFLLGRGTWQIFADWWPRVTDPADPIAGPLNRLTKHVATRTLKRVDWAGSVIVRDVPREVALLKDAPGGELQVHGSPGLIQTLLTHDLIDELRLITFPIALGPGKRLFGSGTVPAAFELVASQVTPRGVVVSTLRRAGKPRFQDVAPQG